MTTTTKPSIKPDTTETPKENRPITNPFTPEKPQTDIEPKNFVC